MAARVRAASVAARSHPTNTALNTTNPHRLPIIFVTHVRNIGAGMRPPIRFQLAAALVVGLLMATLVGDPARASAETDESGDDGTITTVLHPGWNMVAWVGPETPASELFDELPALGRIFAWDRKEQRYQPLMPSSGSAGDQHLLTPGDGLWLYIGGTSPVEWTREASEASVLLELSTGRNLVAWAGRDGTPIEEAVARLGERLELAWAWSAEAQEYRLFAPNAGLDQVEELNHGDALLIELSSGGRWWQSGAAPPPVVFLGEFTDERRAEIGGWADSAQAVYAERWAVQAPMTTYVGDLESITPAYRQIRGGDPPDRFCGNYGNEIFFLWGCIHEASVAHDYFHAVQDHLAGFAYHSVPHWLIEGTAEYAEAVHAALETPELTVPDHLDAEERRIAAQLRRYVLPMLPEIDTFEDFHALPASTGYRIGFVAARWLVDYSSEESMIAFFRAIAGDVSWKDAFESTFAIAVDDFQEEFAGHLAELAPPLPHLIDDSDGPVLIFVGELPPGTESRVRARLASIEELFGKRLATGSAEYTAYIGGDAQSLADVHLNTTGNEIAKEFCRATEAGDFLIATVDCVLSSPQVLQRQHSHSVRERLAPWESLEAREHPPDRRGPMWLLLAIEAYADHAHETEIGHNTRDEIRAEQISIASREIHSLAELVTWDEVRAAGFHTSRMLSSMAGELLAERAGEAALFDYFGQLPTSDTWEAAFEAAFGVSVTDFHEEFDAYRTEFAPPLPHLTDDRDEPVLVLVGEMTPETEDVVRARFASILRFFGDRLEAGDADYTLYVGADQASLAEVHQRTTGRALPEDFCDTVQAGAYAIVTAECIESSPAVLSRHHFFSLRAQLAPRESLPPAPEGHDIRGPLWLLLAIETYAAHAYSVEADGLAPDAIRDDQISTASHLSQPLSALAAWREVHAVGFWTVRTLSSLAGEWLAQRAGEPALFDYFRQLPSSDGWEAAFEAAFGMSVEDFHEEFEAYRAEVAPPYVLHYIRGVVLDPAGNPSEGAWVAANRGEGRWEDTATTGPGGAFELAVRDGSYHLAVDLTTTGCAVPADDRQYPAGMTRVDGTDVTGIEIRLPDGSVCAQS